MDNLKILDCSLRDGGYYNKWDFSEKFIDNYIKNISNLPFDFVEIGYVSVNGNEYFGQIRYIDKHLIDKCKELGIKVAVMIDVKSIDNNLIANINSIKNDVDLFRFAVNYELIDESLNNISKLKLPKEKIAINLMYLSRWINNKDFLNKILKIEKVKYLYLVDSYGSVFPDDVAKVFKFLSSNIKDISLGFHPHNNLELAFANTLQSIKFGATIIDSTFYGMGRGAGNLKSEIILTYLNKKYQLDIDFDSLDILNKSFIKLHEKYKWGVDYPFILSGFLDFPQKDILYHIDQKYLSLKSLVSIISQKNDKLIFGKNFSQIQLNKNEKYLLIGGGDSIEKHKNRILRWLKEKPKINFGKFKLKKKLNFYIEKIIGLSEEEKKIILKKFFSWNKLFNEDFLNLTEKEKSYILSLNDEYHGSDKEILLFKYFYNCVENINSIGKGFNVIDNSFYTREGFKQMKKIMYGEMKKNHRE